MSQRWSWTSYSPTSTPQVLEFQITSVYHHTCVINAGNQTQELLRQTLCQVNYISIWRFQFILGDKILLYSSGWPETQKIDQAGFWSHGVLPASASQEQRLRLWPTISGLRFYFKEFFSCACMFSMNVYMCTLCVPVTFRARGKCQNPWNLSYIWFGYPCGFGSWTQVL